MKAPALSFALAACLAPLAAQKVGDEAPDIVWTAGVGFGDVPSQKLSDLRGSVVLLEVFSTRSTTCQDVVKPLNELFAAKGELGLVVVGVTGEEIGDVVKFADQHGVKFPIGIGSNDRYVIHGVPDAFLIDKDGKIVWRGHPGAVDRAAIDAALVGAKPAIVVPGLEDVQMLRRSKDHGGAYRKAKLLLEGGKLSERAQQQAKEWIDASAKFVAESMTAADAAESQQDMFALWSKLEPVATTYQGVPGADSAKTRLDALLADPKKKREVDAGRRLAEAREREKALDFDGAHAIYKDVAAKFSGTRSAKAAAAAFAAIEKDGKLGFDPTCGYCKAAGVACPAHTKAKKKKK